MIQGELSEGKAAFTIILTKKLNISRATLREAFRNWRMKVINRYHGIRTFVAEDPIIKAVWKNL